MRVTFKAELDEELVRDLPRDEVERRIKQMFEPVVAGDMDVLLKDPLLTIGRKVFDMSTDDEVPF